MKEIIVKKIRDEGPISFHDFMELCLYYPDLGYYTSAGNKIGTAGDYYTSPTLGPLFGSLLGKQLEEMWRVLGEKPFTIVEYGAGPGQLCQDILEYARHNEKFYEQLQYCIIEKSAAMREQEKMHLHEKVSWHDSIEELAGISGCILSNELLDNFPVHRVVMQEELMEVFVDYRDGFVEILRPAGQMLQNYFTELNVNLPAGYRTEINLQALDWIKEIAGALKEGYVITIDYGYTSDVLYNESRKGGTLLCYYQHRLSDDPYQHIGEQDITSHVNFSALCQWGLQSGLSCSGLTRQANFLLGLGFEGLAGDLNVVKEDLPGIAKREAFLKHTLLVDMGGKFKVLIQSKGVGTADLSGLRFA
jgi:SAM-dependent MidA family methyltransferase